jgi:hypothetical protein
VVVTPVNPTALNRNAEESYTNRVLVVGSKAPLTGRANLALEPAPSVLEEEPTSPARGMRVHPLGVEEGEGEVEGVGVVVGVGVGVVVGERRRWEGERAVAAAR